MKKRKKLKISSIIKFYWVLLLFGIVMSPLVAHYTQTYFPDFEYKKFIPQLFLTLVVSIVFFDALNIAFLKANTSYETLAWLAKKTHKKKQFQFFCMCSGGALLGNAGYVFCNHNNSGTYIFCFIATLLLGWFLTGVIQMLRFR